MQHRVHWSHSLIENEKSHNIVVKLYASMCSRHNPTFNIYSYTNSISIMLLLYFRLYCRAASSLTSRPMVIFKSVDMETARLHTRPNTTLAFQVSQLTVYLSIWRLQDSSRPGQIQPWTSRSVNWQYICRYGDCKTPAHQAKYNPGLLGQSTDSISVDMETARLQHTRPNTTLDFQVSQLTVYLPIWRLQDSSRPGQIQPCTSRSVNWQYICRYGDCKTPAHQAKYNPGLPGQSTDSISADMETARIQQTRPNTAMDFQVSQLTVYLPIWRLQDSSTPGQIQPWPSRSVNWQYICRYGDCKNPADQAKYSPALPGQSTDSMYLHGQTRKSLFVQTTDIACWSVNADHSLQDLLVIGYCSQSFAGQTTGRPSMDRRKIDLAGQSI
jgi:hypothetical protein